LKISENFWHKAILNSSSLIKDSIANLNETGLRIVLVVNNENSFVGTISDGDIRRGLLSGLSIEDSIDTIIHSDALIVPPGFTKDSALKLMELNQIFQIPIISDNKKILGMYTRDNISHITEVDNIMVIMAGGIGSRLLPHTEDCPKPMLKVSGKPILEHIIDRAKLDGFKHFIIAINYLGDVIESYFGNGNTMNIKIDYIREDKPLGTAGALSLLDLKIDKAFIVTNGDVITDIRYAELLDFHLNHNAEATMAVNVHEWQNPYGVVDIQGIEINGFSEKPINKTHINAGVYALSKNTLNYLNKNVHCDMPFLFELLRKDSKRIIAYPMHEPWLDVGVPDDLKKANKENE
tara:strand:- start:11712 stop:12761 length:1050 start_codon:yes stop_codon:yes gene_type:complete